MTKNSKLRYAWGAPLTLAMLGCFIPAGPEIDPGQPDFDDEPYVNPQHRERDDPQSENYRGRFSLSVTGEDTLTLDSSSLGEATYSYVGDDPFGAPPHCALTLADRTADSSGYQGYVIIQIFGDTCPSAGSFAISSLADGDTPDPGTASIKTLQIDRETDTESVFTSYLDTRGSLTLIEQRNGVLRGSFVTTSFARRVDGDDQDAMLDAEATFELVWLPIIPGTPPPR